MKINSVKVICVYKNTKKVLLEYACTFRDLFVPRIGETIVINIDKPFFESVDTFVVLDVKHVFEEFDDIDGYTIYIHLEEKY